MIFPLKPAFIEDFPLGPRSIFWGSHASSGYSPRQKVAVAIAEEHSIFPASNVVGHCDHDICGLDCLSGLNKKGGQVYQVLLRATIGCPNLVSEYYIYMIIHDVCICTYVHNYTYIHVICIPV